jgi:hypothetical protein
VRGDGQCVWILTANTWVASSQAKAAWLTGFAEDERLLVEAGNGPEHTAIGKVVAFSVDTVRDAVGQVEKWRGIRLRKRSCFGLRRKRVSSTSPLR